MAEETAFEFVIWELALSVVKKAPLADQNRIQDGDIVGIRRPGGVIGRKEALDFMWLRVQNISTDEAFTMLDAIADGDTQDSETITTYEKRRYTILLSELATRFPAFDIAAAMDRSRIYQPFVPIDDAYHCIQNDITVLSARGLIYDKMLDTFM